VAAASSAAADAGSSPPVAASASSAGSSNTPSSSASAAAPTPTQAWVEAFPTFTAHEIASFDSGYYTLVFDVDGDGKPDVVALSSGSAGLVWYKNPGWEKYTITKTAKLICMAPYDVDGDGDMDLAVQSDFDMNNSTKGGTISWAEAPDDPTTSQDWTLHKIDAVPTSHRVRFGDIDGDGKKELLNLPIFGVGSDTTTRAGAVELRSYKIPADPKGAWQGTVLDDKLLEVAHGINLVDWDGDKAEDILTAANNGVELFRPGLGVPPQHIGAGKDGTQPNRGSSEVSLGSLRGARFISTIEPWHGTDAVIYTPGATEADLWKRETIGTEFEHGHGMATADLDGDGYDEVVAGGGQGALTQLIYRYNPNTSAWQRIELDIGGVAVSALVVQDMNGDGALDIVSIGGSPTNNVVWYENTR
jgi:FG-GAP-like repeat